MVRCFVYSSRRGLAALSILVERQCEGLMFGIDRGTDSHAFFCCILLNRGRLSVLCLFSMESIGSLIKQELEKQERSISWLARKLSCDRTKVYRLLQKHSIDTYDLARISILLSHDFFADLSEDLKKDEHLQKCYN